MPDVKQIKAAIRQHNAGAPCSARGQERNKFVGGDDGHARDQRHRNGDGFRLSYPVLFGNPSKDLAQSFSACSARFSLLIFRLAAVCVVQGERNI